MRDAVLVATGRSVAFVVCNFFQPIVDVARIQTKTVTKGRLNNDKANGKGKVGLECAAAVQFMCGQRERHSLLCALRSGG